MNEAIIKEIKTIYSGRVTPENSPVVTPEVKKETKKVCKSKTFFNGVMEKLDILVNNKSKWGLLF